MNISQQVITCFMLNHGGETISQGSFQVLEKSNTTTFLTADGNELEFSHLYTGSTCSIAVVYQQSGATVHSLELDISINKTKVKWKQANFGATHELFYRSVFESTA